MIKLITLILFSVLSVSMPACADTTEKTSLAALAQERTWLRLLYFDEKNGESEVISPAYFLSETGRYDPLEELEATLDAYSEPFGETPDTHAVCRFPARYEWLNRQIELPEYQTVHPKCAKLRESLEKTEIGSISLMFVSGYLGNPASSFGHSFLKLNAPGDSSGTNLFDLSVSYGAEVPENENIFLYMYRGLTGKYEARFTDKYFYSQDLVYSNTEFRDIWEYELDLPPEKVTFFQLHLWEILGQQIQYFFFNKNCAYEVSKMLEVVTEEDLVKSADYWFAPIESFHAMTESTKIPLRKVAYHPSAQKKLYRRFELLGTDEQTNAIAMVQNGMPDHLQSYAALQESSKIRVINFALSYYQYLLIKDRGNSTYRALKNSALRKRFALPVKRDDEVRFDQAVAPHHNDKPSILFAKFNSSEHQPDHTSIGYTPFALQSLGQNNIDGDELVMLESELGFTADDAFLKRLDIIRIKQFDRHHIPLTDENKLSWQMAISVKNTDIETDTYDAIFEGGVGKTWLPARQLMLFAMMNASLHSHQGNIVLTPELGLWMAIRKVRIRMSLQNDYEPLYDKERTYAEASSHLKLTKDLALTFEYTCNEHCRLSAGMQFFF